jgi:hypothetical protein
MIFRFAIEPMRDLDRVLTPEILDSLDPRDPLASRSRRDLVLSMRSWGIRVGSRNPWRVILRSAIPLVADPRAFRSESPKRSTARHLADRKCHAEGLTLSHDLEIHPGSNG